MLTRRLRAASALLLAGTLVWPTMMVAAPTRPTTASKSASSKTRHSAVVAATSGGSTSATKTKTGSSTAKKSTTTTRRRTRRGPPGGVCYARNAIVVDPASGQVLFEKNAETTVPVASLTKLMTALVFLEQEPDFDRMGQVTREELTGGGHTQLRRGERVRLGDLLHMSLMCSDNVATRVLARESGLSRTDFVDAMNRKSVELGMSRSRYVEFTGLDERNVSSAADIARLLETAARNPVIHRITTTRAYDFVSATRPHTIPNTNRLLYGRYEVVGGKTGYISEAGYCFATWIRDDGRDRIAVVLGAPTAATRFADVVRMIQRTTSASFAPTQL